MWKKIKPYIIAIAIPLAVGVISALLTMGSMDIYEEINTPSFAPPSILFPIVWTVLYILMGVSSAMVYTQRKNNYKEARLGLTAYGISLFFNFFWSIIFFNLRAFDISFFWLLAMLFFIIKYTASYYKINKAASLLQIPYILWTVFAGALNYAIWMLN